MQPLVICSDPRAVRQHGRHYEADTGAIHEHRAETDSFGNL
ncbi:hypothetical protein ACIQJ4_08740 [Streptomyces filamentosus]